jgi:hypothetical protein
MSKSKFFIFPFVIFSLYLTESYAQMNYRYPTINDDIVIAPDKLDLIDRKVNAAIHTMAGRARALEIKTEVAKLFPGFKLASACMGSMLRPDSKEIAASIVNVDLTRVIYLVSVEGKTSSTLTRLTEFTDIERGISLPRYPGVDCNSWTELERQNRQYIARHQSEKPLIRRLSYLDVACISPYSSDFEHICYGYSEKQKAFVSIGGISAE